LRWYASGLFGGDTWFTWLFGRQSTVPQPSFSGFYAPASYLIVLLEVFTITLFACAVAAEYVSIIFERLTAQSIMARTEAERGQELWTSLIERLPLPALLIDPATMRVVASSEFAISYLRGGEMPLEGRNLFEALQFSYPDTVHELIVGSDGAAPWTVIRVADQLRVTQARVLHVVHRGHRLALLTIEDATEAFCLKAALDTSEYAALVVDARGRILAFNKRVVGLFGNAEIGADAAQLLPQPGTGSRWWDPGLTERRKMHVEIGPRIYQVTSSAIALAGEEERIFTVSFLPVAKGSAADPHGTSSTMVTGTLGQMR
jgi:PAS domain-containing protein